MNQFYVYAYFNPCDDLPFYIGKGHGDRDMQHLRPSELKKRTPFYCKLRKMLAQGSLPKIVRLAGLLSETDAFVLESFFILALDTQGPEQFWALVESH